MAFYLVQSGTKLYKVDTNGNAVELALPSGVTINSARRGRFAILDRTVVFVNAPSLNLQIDPNLTVRILTPTTPTTSPVAAAGAAGALTGSYRYGVTFAIMSGTRVITESGMSDPSSAVVLALQQGALSSIPVSAQPGINARRIYRTLNGGTDFFLVTTIVDNTSTTLAGDNTTDEEAAAGTPLDEGLGQPPGATTGDYIEEIVAWKDRLWIMSHNEPDRIRFSANGLAYGFNEDNEVKAKPVGADLAGGTGFIARRDELGIGKRRKFMKVIGNDESDFEVIGVNEDVGIWAPESAVVNRDIGYFLAEDGVYAFASGPLTCLSREKVHPWFTTDDFFNRALFPQAFAHYNQRLDGYQLWLASAGSDVIDRWVFLDMKTRNWYGPHKTAALTASCVGVFEDNDGLVVPVIGDVDGQIWRMNQPAFRDGASAIDFDVYGKFHSQGNPDSTKVWGPLSVFNKAESGGTLTIEARVGGLNARMGPVAITTLARGAQNPTTLISIVTVATAEEHQFGDGADIEILGAVETDYNGTWTITRVDASTFTFELPTLTPTTPATGTLTAEDPARRALEHDLTLSRELLAGGGLGVGELAQLRWRQSTIDQGVRLYGYLIDPVVDIGVR